MKKHLILSAAVLSVFAGFFSSCGEDVSSSADAKGHIAPVVGVEHDLIEAEIESRSLTVPKINVGDLYFRVTSSDGSYSREWASVNDFSADETFPIGDYTVEVGYADPTAEGLKCTPAYYATADIKVEENKTVPVQLSATRTHAYISVSFSDAVKGYFRRVGVDVKSASGKHTTFTYSPSYTETATACVVPGDAVITLDLEKKNGIKGENIKIAEFSAEARNHYTINLEVNEGEVGSGTLAVSFDDKTTQRPIEVDLSDELLTTPAPELALDGVEDGGMLEFVEGCYAGDPVKVIVNARGDIASVNLDTHSAYLYDVCSWPLSVDLVNAPDDERDHMIAAGLVCKGIWSSPNREPSRIGFIDFTEVLNNINYLEFDPDHDNECTFEINATDGNGKMSETSVSFKAKISKLNFAIANPASIKFFETALALDLEFNGGDPTGKVDFSVMKDDLGTGAYYEPVKVSKVEPAGENKYRVSLTGLPVYGSVIDLRASYKEHVADLTVERVSPAYSISTAAGDIDVYATKAYITVESSEIDPTMLAAMTSIWSGDNKLTVEQIDNTAMLLVSGLEPGKANVIAASLTDNPERICAPITLNTEVDDQLPNRNMEKWDTDKFVAGAEATCNGVPIIGTGGGNNHWDHFYPYKKAENETKGWETVNEITLSDARKDRCNFGYCTASGTISTNDGRSGLAALVRTVGWGQGATSAGDNSIFKNITAGQLYLGSFNLSTNKPDYGYEFNSRPTSLEFYYKYVPKNAADYASVEVRVMDKDGNLITKKADLTNEVNMKKIIATNSYTKGSVDFDYNLRAKAKSITVIFISSANEDCLHANKDNLDPPGSGKLDGTQAVGSQLYIDDVKLIY